VIYLYSFALLNQYGGMRFGPRTNSAIPIPGIGYQNATFYRYTNNAIPVAAPYSNNHFNGAGADTYIADPLTFGQEAGTGVTNISGGNVTVNYSPWKIDATPFKAGTEKAAQQIKVTVEHTAANPHPIAAMYLTDYPSTTLFLTVFALETLADTPLAVFTGRVRAVDFKEGSADIFCTSIDDVLQRTGLSRNFSRQCPYALYDPTTCGVYPNAQDSSHNPLYSITGTFTFISDDRTTLQSAAFASAPVVTSLPPLPTGAGGNSASALQGTVNALDSAYAQATDPTYATDTPSYGATESAPVQGGSVSPMLSSTLPVSFMTNGYIVVNGAVRSVLSHVGNTVILTTPLPATPVGTSFTGYRGCTHALDFCYGVFNNAGNYGGFPDMPGTNPFETGLLE
jgi:hypothetical protein